MPTEVSLESVTLADQVSGSKRVTVKESDEAYINRPNIDGAKFLINGEIRDWTGEVQIVESPVYLEGSDTMVTVSFLLKCDWKFDFIFLRCRTRTDCSSGLQDCDWSSSANDAKGCT
jgi:hypothetical protein